MPAWYQRSSWTTVWGGHSRKLWLRAHYTTGLIHGDCVLLTVNHPLLMIQSHGKQSSCTRQVNSAVFFEEPALWLQTWHTHPCSVKPRQAEIDRSTDRQSRQRNSNILRRCYNPSISWLQFFMSVWLTRAGSISTSRLGNVSNGDEEAVTSSQKTYPSILNSYVIMCFYF